MAVPVLAAVYWLSPMLRAVVAEYAVRMKHPSPIITPGTHCLLKILQPRIRLILGLLLWLVVQSIQRRQYRLHRW